MRHEKANDVSVARYELDVDGTSASYLSAASDGPIVLLLHGTYWSRVWLPVLEPLARAGLRPIAVDLPGLGRSGGELTLETGAVPALTAWVERFLDRVGAQRPLLVAGHDIGGAIAQRLLAIGAGVERLALVNSVTYDSWPVPAVARFRDPAIVASTPAEEILELRRQAIVGAITRPISDKELDDYSSPWRDPRVARSWMALAGAASPRYTLELLPALRSSQAPKLLIWGENDLSQRIQFAEKFVSEMPASKLVRIAGAGHIPMEIEPARIARELASFFLA